MSRRETVIVPARPRGPSKNESQRKFSEIEGRCAALGKVPLTLHDNGEAMSWMMAKMMGTCPPGRESTDGKSGLLYEVQPVDS